MLLAYVNSFIYVSKIIVTSFDNFLYKFVWRNKHHVKKTALIANPATGGLKMLDVKAVVKGNNLNFMKGTLSL